MTPEKEYEFCIGKVGILPSVYWLLTPAETKTIVDGWLWREDKHSDNFREIFSLQYNQWNKPKKTKFQLWPLGAIDARESKFETKEDEYGWRGKMIEWAKEKKLFA